ncbi:MAG: hypothetical protein QOI61_37 [Actinomycetota bacterium]
MSVSRGARVGLAAVIGVLLCGDLAVLRQGVAAAPPEVPPQLAGVLPELERFVERTRGLQFRKPVRVELLERDEFERVLSEHAEQDITAVPLIGQNQSDDPLGMFRVLGFTLPEQSEAQREQAEGEGVVGLYSPREEALYVVGREPTPFVRRVLVHELTHALDDQHFGLDRDDLFLHDDEQGLAFRSLAEGDAVWVENKYVESLPADEKAAAEKDAEAAASDSLPELMIALLGFPYRAGPVFVDALRAKSVGRLNAAFTHPPASSSHILEPERYASGDTAARLTKPQPRGPAVSRGVLGEYMLFLVLSQSLHHDVAKAAATGWDGDRYVAWTEGAKTCFEMNVQTTTEPANQALIGAWNQWLAVHPGGTVTGSRLFSTLSRCA